MNEVESASRSGCGSRCAGGERGALDRVAEPPVARQQRLDVAEGERRLAQLAPPFRAEERQVEVARKSFSKVSIERGNRTDFGEVPVDICDTKGQATPSLEWPGLLIGSEEARCATRPIPGSIASVAAMSGVVDDPVMFRRPCGNRSHAISVAQKTEAASFVVDTRPELPLAELPRRALRTERCGDRRPILVVGQVCAPPARGLVADDEALDTPEGIRHTSTVAIAASEFLDRCASRRRPFR